MRTPFASIIALPIATAYGEEWLDVFADISQAPSFEAFNLKFSKPLNESRREIYLSNVAYIAKRNSEQDSFRLGINEFADQHHTEFKASMLSEIPVGLSLNKEKVANLTFEPVPNAVDWRKSNTMTDVKNQGQCGSCWAFASVGAIESRYAIATGSLRSLSEQELVDCVSGNKGCGGGQLDLAFQFVIENKGIDEENDYTYAAAQNSCDINREGRVAARISDFKHVPSANEQQFLQAIAQGPVAVAIEADERDFMLYKSGVLDAPCGSKLDHGVLAVGYTPDAIIVKNSWGASWGENGYIRLKRYPVSPQHPTGQCGILTIPTFPIVTDKEAVPLTPPTPTPPAGLKCECIQSCDDMCKQFGMRCCSGKNGNCNCMPQQDGCCNSNLRPWIISNELQ